MEPYEYVPLANPSAEIRTFVLHADLARLPDGQEVPRASLRVVQLLDGHAYTALSYCWGDARKMTLMLLDGKPKRITQSLAAHLHHAVDRMQCNELAQVVYWVDAVCINQADNEEKSFQVQLMGDIFSNARFVEAWLGPASSSSLAAFNCMRDLAQMTIDASPDSKRATGTISRVDLDRCSYITHHFTERLAPLYELLQRPWWRRVWVQQEVVLAPLNRITLVCGHDRIDFASVALAFLAIHSVNQLPVSVKHRSTNLDKDEPNLERLYDIASCMMPYLSAHPQMHRKTSILRKSHY